MGRRIPNALMPHLAWISRWKGEGSTSPLYEPEGDPFRAQFDGGGSALGRTVSVGAQDLVIAGRVYMDAGVAATLPLLSKVRSSVDGTTLLVAARRIYDGGGLRYVILTLGQ